MRFPYSVVCALFAFPAASNRDVTAGRRISTFERATRLMATVSGRATYTDPGEKFENVTMMLFQPVHNDGPEPWVRLFDSKSGRELSEDDYLAMICEIYNSRNPHAMIGDEQEEANEEGVLRLGL